MCLITGVAVKKTTSLDGDLSDLDFLQPGPSQFEWSNGARERILWIADKPETVRQKLIDHLGKKGWARHVVIRKINYAVSVEDDIYTKGICVIKLKPASANRYYFGNNKPECMIVAMQPATAFQQGLWNFRQTVSRAIPFLAQKPYPLIGGKDSHSGPHSHGLLLEDNVRPVDPYLH